LSRPDREKFEEDYLGWLLSVAKDSARILAYMPTAERELTAKKYKQLLDPKSVIHKLSDPKRIERLTCIETSRYIVVETEAITFFPSILYSRPRCIGLFSGHEQALLLSGTMVSHHCIELGLYKEEQR
jgi:hypothetical protein